VRQALQVVRDRRAAAIEVREEVEAASDRAVQARFAGTAWLECDSWYRNENGRIVANWPGYMRDYLQQAGQLRREHFSLLSAPDNAAVAHGNGAAANGSDVADGGPRAAEEPATASRTRATTPDEDGRSDV
jgi:hypothetical protein